MAAAAQFTTHGIEAQRPQIGHGVDTQRLLEAILQFSSAGTDVVAQVEDRQRLIDMGQGIFPGAVDHALARRGVERRRLIRCHQFQYVQHHRVTQATADRLVTQ
ncbi:hypothetical protein D3C78_1521390 [compost metagenome]